jgi:hypothetical protein
LLVLLDVIHDILHKLMVEGFVFDNFLFELNDCGIKVITLGVVHVECKILIIFGQLLFDLRQGLSLLAGDGFLTLYHQLKL